MNWHAYYLPPDPHLWQGRQDCGTQPYFFNQVQCLDLKNQTVFTTNRLTFGLIGFICDEGIRRNLGRLGAKEGATKIKQSLAPLPLHRQDVVCLDLGAIHCEDGNLENAQLALAEVIHKLLSNQVIPIVLGGGHELSFGSYQGIVRAYPTESMAIINFDAHFDMRPCLAENQGSSGTPFLQIAQAQEKANRAFHYYCLGIQTTGNSRFLFDTAHQHNVAYLLANDLHHAPASQFMPFIQKIITTHDILHLSLCLDVFGSMFAPGVSAPQVNGLAPWMIAPFLSMLALSGKVVCYDIAELSPHFDSDARTAKLAAHLIFEIIHQHAGTRSPYESVYTS